MQEILKVFWWLTIEHEACGQKCRRGFCQWPDLWGAGGESCAVMLPSSSCWPREGNSCFYPDHWVWHSWFPLVKAQGDCPFSVWIPTLWHSLPEEARQFPLLNHPKFSCIFPILKSHIRVESFVLLMMISLLLWSAIDMLLLFLL